MARRRRRQRKRPIRDAMVDELPLEIRIDLLEEEDKK
jgi:hypothetical protein